MGSSSDKEDKKPPMKPNSVYSSPQREVLLRQISSQRNPAPSTSPQLSSQVTSYRPTETSKGVGGSQTSSAYSSYSSQQTGSSSSANVRYLTPGSLSQQRPSSATPSVNPPQRTSVYADAQQRMTYKSPAAPSYGKPAAVVHTEEPSYRAVSAYSHQREIYPQQAKSPQTKLITGEQQPGHSALPWYPSRPNSDYVATAPPPQLKPAPASFPEKITYRDKQEPLYQPQSSSQTRGAATANTVKPAVQLQSVTSPNRSTPQAQSQRVSADQLVHASASLSPPIFSPPKPTFTPPVVKLSATSSQPSPPPTSSIDKPQLPASELVSKPAALLIPSFTQIKPKADVLILPTQPPILSARPRTSFSSLEDYAEHFANLLDLERQELSNSISPKLAGSKLKLTGQRGKRYTYKLTLKSVEDFSFGDQFLLKYKNEECDPESSHEVVHIHELDEDSKSIEFLGKRSDGTEIQYYQSLPHRRMVTKLESLEENHPLLDLILGDMEANNESMSYFPYNPSENSRIDECQGEAIFTALNSKVTLIHGPPGSGKTSVAAELIGKLALTDQKILVCAPSNVATDNLAIRLKEKHMNVLRFYSKGSEKKSNIADKFAFHSYVHSLACVYFPASAGRLLQLKNYSRNAVKSIIGEEEIVAIEKEVLESHQIICATCSASADAILDNFNFDTVLIDEAAFCCEPEAMIPIAGGCKRVVLVGDPYQLRPIIMSDEAKTSGLECSMFERLMATIHPKMLAKQYRMHPVISYYPRMQFYGGKLEDGIDASKRNLDKYAVVAMFEKSPVVFVHCKGKEDYYLNTPSRWNEREANLMIETIHKMKKLNVHLSSIGVVTPYEGQRETISKLAEEKLGITPSDLEVKNVDGYQGREKDFILMSCVRSNCLNIGFLSNKNRINVALTRAKFGLIMIGNADTLSMDGNWAGFITYIREKGNYMLEEDFEKFGEGQSGKEKFGFT